MVPSARVFPHRKCGSPRRLISCSTAYSHFLQYLPMNTAKSNVSALQSLIESLMIPGLNLLAGTAEKVDIVLTPDNYQSYIDANANKDLFLLGGVDPTIGVRRAKDNDVRKKNYFLVDIDVREIWRKKREEITDEHIKEQGIAIVELLNKSGTIAGDWRLIVFSGNGLHIWYVGDPIAIESKEAWKEGLRTFLRGFEMRIGLPPDYACINLSRLSRIPCSYNNKKGRHTFVEVLATQDKRMDLENIIDLGEKSLQSLRESALAKLAEAKRTTVVGSNTYVAIQAIPIGQVVSRIMGWEFDGRNFVDPAMNPQKQKACYVPEGENFIVHGGTDHFSNEQKGYGPFEFVKMHHQFDNKQTFEWFRTHYPDIEEVAKRDFAEKKKSAKQEKKASEEDDEDDEEEAPPPTFEVRLVPEPSTAPSFAGWKEVIDRHFPVLLPAAEAGLSLVCQLLIRDITNCGALVLVDVPSTGKTIAINFFDGIEEITYSSDSFTPASFVSNAAKVSKKRLAKIDLLPRIRRRMFMVRDMATIFSEREDDLLKNLGTLTRVLDGEGLATDTGVHGRRRLRGDYVFMFLAASTPLPMRVWKAMGTLGPRLFFLGLHTPDKQEHELAEQLRKTPYKQKEAECQKMTRDFLYSLWRKYPQGVTWEKENDPLSALVIISRCAMLLARLRGQVKVWKSDDDKTGENIGFTIPIIEKPDRVNQCLYNYARGHALAMGRTNIADEDMALVIRLTFDSAPGHRASLFRELIRHNGELRTSEIEEFLHCSNPTALKEMKAFVLLGICDEIEGNVVELEASNKIRLKNDLQWFLSDECRRFLASDARPEQSNTSKKI